MNYKYNARRRLYQGVQLLSNGVQKAAYFQKTDLTNSFVIPVQWIGKSAVLHFWNWRGRLPVNDDATDLITHPGFLIRGTAKIVTGSTFWHHFYVPGNELQVRARLAHMEDGYTGPVIFRPGGRHHTHQNIYVSHDNDALAIRMAL